METNKSKQNIKSLKSFINEASINEAAARTEGQKYLKKYVPSGSPKTAAAIGDYFVAYYIGCESTVDPILSIAMAIKSSVYQIDKCLKKDCPDNEELKEYKDNLLKLQKLINDNFKK